MVRKVRNSLWAVSVWATMASSLLAAIPRISCRCPDGHVKLFCFHSLLSDYGCCGRSCCQERESSSRPSGTSQAKKKCCCCKQTAKNPSSPRAVGLCTSEQKAQPRQGLVIGKPDCQKSVVQPDPSSLTRAESTATQEHFPLVFFLLPIAETAAHGGLPLVHVSRHCAAPLTDFVTLFQHLTI